MSSSVEAFQTRLCFVVLYQSLLLCSPYQKEGLPHERIWPSPFVVTVRDHLQNHLPIHPMRLESPPIPFRLAVRFE